METNNIVGGIARTVDTAAANMHSAINRVSDAAHPAVEQVSAGVHQAMNKVSGAASAAAQTLDEKGRQLINVQMRLADGCRAQIAEKPLTTLAIAVGAGFMLNWLLRVRPFTRHSNE